MGGKFSCLVNRFVYWISDDAREKRKCHLARISGGRRGKRIGRILHVRMQLVSHEGGYDGAKPADRCAFSTLRRRRWHTHTNLRPH